MVFKGYFSEAVIVMRVTRVFLFLLYARRCLINHKHACLYFIIPVEDVKNYEPYCSFLHTVQHMTVALLVASYLMIRPLSAHHRLT